VNRYLVDSTGMHERASASPTRPGPPARPAAPSKVGEQVAERPVTLRDLQVWFVRAVTTPESEPAAASDAAAARVLTAGPRSSAIERLEIYRQGYHSRLIECLADDYAVLQHALGTPAFEELCRAYVARHPSSGPSLNFFGRHLAEFCRNSSPRTLAPSRAFAADLAALEWAIVEVIHAPSSDPLTLEGLHDVPLDAWATARLVANPALRLLRFDHPVNAYLQAFRSAPAAAPIALPGPSPSATVVYRSGPTVWRMDLTVPMFDVLSALVAGETLGDALARAETSLGDIDEQEAGARVLGWFREWVGSGLFSRVVLA
jgi:Putative DNA-binding domain